jgi:sortase A
MTVRIARGIRHPAKRVNRFAQWTAYTFLAAGILVLCYCVFIFLDTKIFQAYQDDQFEKELSNVRPAIGDAVGEKRSLAAAIPGGVLGRIEVPRIGLSAMIMEGTTGRTLRLAVGHIPGTPMPGQTGNVAIAGHRDTFFRPLRNIQQGDRITLTTLNGANIYLVDSTRVVAPEEMQVLDNSEDAVLTLVTCYPFYFVGASPKRFIVRAHKMAG